MKARTAFFATQRGQLCENFAEILSKEQISDLNNNRKKKTSFQYSHVSTWYYPHYLPYNLKACSVKAITKKKRLLSIFNSRMYVSSCQFVDVRIDIVKCEEGFLAKSLKRGYILLMFLLKLDGRLNFNLISSHWKTWKRKSQS